MRLSRSTCSERFGESGSYQHVFVDTTTADMCYLDYKFCDSSFFFLSYNDRILYELPV